MIEIEFNEPFRSVCKCCGETTTALTRFVNRDQNAYAIYYAFFSEGHPERGLVGLVSLGEWGTEDVPKNRFAFGFEMWTTQDQYQIGLVDAQTTPWGRAKIVGQKLSREEALEHPWLDEVFHITDHIAEEDSEVRAFFGQETVH